MNEIQFAKNTDIENVRQVVSDAPVTATHWDVSTGTFVDNYEGDEQPNLLEIEILKRLVDSVDTINEIGTLEAAKKKLRFASWEGSSEPDYVFTPLIQEEYLHLERSIKDYEYLYVYG